MDLDGWTGDLLIFLVTAGIIVPVFYRARVGTVLAFLIAGVALGPHGLATFADDAPWLRHVTFVEEERVASFAELGVMFLLFTIGLELSLTRLWAMRKLVFGAGSIQTLVTAVAVGGLSLLFDVPPEAAIVFGLGLAFSSTAIVLQLLIQQRRLSGDLGAVTLGILLMQDLLVVPGVILVTVLGDDTSSVGLSLLRGIGLAVAVVTVILAVGQYVLRPLVRLAASTGSREIVLAIAILVAIGGAALTAAAGLSPALGAFLGGLLFGSSEYRHQVEVDIEPFKGLLLGLFFMSVGMTIDLALLGSEFIAVVAAVAALFLLKSVIAAGAARLFGVPVPAAVEAGILMAGAGEFAFVLFTLARREGLMTSSDLGFVATVAAVSMMLTPAVGVLARRVGKRLARNAAPAGQAAARTETDEFSEHVIIGGYGRVGEVVAAVLDATATPYVALDLNATRVSEARAAGRPVIFGDASRQEILERVGAGRARAFVLTADLPAETDRTVAMIRSHWPDARIFARARDVNHARGLSAQGVAAAVPEAFEGSLALADRVLAGIGVSAALAGETIGAARAGALSAGAGNAERHSPPAPVQTPPPG
ncbi:MAG: cation:proton antiporter [Bauldia sp.]|nr:cation:proton antiporter [Bauldia sp.]